MAKNPPDNAGAMGSIPGSGRSPEKKMATHSSNPMDRGAWTEGLRLLCRKEPDLATTTEGHTADKHRETVTHNTGIQNPG